MYVIKQHSYPSKPRYVAWHSFIPGSTTEWTDTIHTAERVASKQLASLYVADIPDTVYIKVAYLVTLVGEEKVYYIEKIIGPHTVAWTDEIEDALEVELVDAKYLMEQYGATITVVES